MKNRNEEGVALIMVLILASVLIIAISATLTTLNIMNAQNRKMKDKLQKKAEKFSFDSVKKI